MAQFSGPTSIGTDSDRQLSDVLWRSRFGDEAGVLADYDGTAYALTVTGADTCTIGSATQDSHATVAGFAHRIPSGGPEAVTVPAAVGATRTDRIVLRYDPTWGGALGPVRLTRIEGTSSSAPAYDAGPGGIEEMPLYSITRAVGQTLAQATIKKEYPRIAPVLELPVGAERPTSSPIGTLLFQGPTQYRRTLNSNNTVSWNTAIQPGADVAYTPFAATINGWTSRGTTSCGYEVANRWACVNINFARSSWEADTLIATVPDGVKPGRARFFLGQYGGALKGEVRVETDGRIFANNAGSTAIIATLGYPVVV